MPAGCPDATSSGTMPRMRRTSSTFSAADGLTLFERHWLPEDAPRADRRAAWSGFTDYR